MRSTSALVFGFNGNDPDPNKRLNLAETDSLSIRRALEGLRFWIPEEAVGIGENATFARLKTAAQFVSKERPVGLLFFFAGHGTLLGGRNRIELADRVCSLEEVKEVIQSYARDLRRLVMIVDACRVVLGSEPGGQGFSPGALSRSERGVIETGNGSAEPKGASNPDMAYMFGCSWGSTSVELPDSEHGIFTGALIGEIEHSSLDDALVLTALADRLKMDGNQKAAVIDRYGLALRTLGDSPTGPPSEQFESAIEYVACVGQRALCLTVNGELAISVAGRRWEYIVGAPFLSAGLAGQLFFAHSKSLLMARVGHETKRPKPIGERVGQFVPSPGGKWLAAVPIPDGGSKTEIYLVDDTSEPAAYIQVPDIQQLAFVDEGQRLLIIDRSGKVVLHDLVHGSTLSIQDRLSPVHPARVAVSPDGKWAAWCDWAGRLWIWTPDADVLEEAPLFPVPVTSLAFSSTGMIAVGLANGTALTRQSEDIHGPFKLLPRLRVGGLVTTLAFAQEDKCLVIGTSRGRLLIVNRLELG